MVMVCTFWSFLVTNLFRKDIVFAINIQCYLTNLLNLESSFVFLIYLG